MIDNRTLQQWLMGKGFYRDRLDGDWGANSENAGIAAIVGLGVNARKWPPARIKVGVAQAMLRDLGFTPGIVDGFMGPDTQMAIERWQDIDRTFDRPDILVAHQPDLFPREKDCLEFYGDPGTNQVALIVPFPLRLAWNPDQTIKKFQINAKCAQSAGRAYQRILDHYGHERIKELGLDLWGGCYANRVKRGGTTRSMHAYAAAIDTNPEENQLRWGPDRAAMMKPECAAFLDAWEAEGWISLGRERGYDAMHVQAARL